MLAIKLKRIGRKHQPSYRLVVAERRSKIGGKYTEDVGWYSPMKKEQGLKADRIKYWIGVGAQPTDTVHNLLVSEGILESKKRAVHTKSKKTEEELAAKKAPKAEEVQTTDAPAVEPTTDAPVEEKPTEEAPAETPAEPVEESKTEEKVD